MGWDGGDSGGRLGWDGTPQFPMFLHPTATPQQPPFLAHADPSPPHLTARLAGDGGGRLVSHPSLPMLVSPISSPSLCTTTHFHLPAASRFTPPHPTTPHHASPHPTTPHRTPPHPSTPGSQVTVVGDWDPAWPALRTLEFGRQSIRSPFESNVIYNFELMECVPHGMLMYGMAFTNFLSSPPRPPSLSLDHPLSPTRVINNFERPWDAYGPPFL
ncbi:unnamed protein product [Closterium sp. NIES-65]|nr:unnamed protein product [Closterium sp. NIES-65]